MPFSSGSQNYLRTHICSDIYSIIHSFEPHSKDKKIIALSLEGSNSAGKSERESIYHSLCVSSVTVVINNHESFSLSVSESF